VEADNSGECFGDSLIKDHSVWDEDLIEERSKTLFNVDVKISPRPQSRPRFVSNGDYQAKGCCLTPGA
jgi:hypothetical protein